MTKVILASNSPRRKELLEREGIDFVIDASSVEEVLDTSLPLKQQLQKLAYDKGVVIHEKYPQDIVISADTTVYHDGEIIGKPEDEAHARAILMSLSDDEHMVYTSVCIFYRTQLISWVEETVVRFKDITDLLDAYIATQEWMGKAGAYGIQGAADVFVAATDGDIDSVIGLPVKRVVSEIKMLLQDSIG